MCSSLKKNYHENKTRQTKKISSVYFYFQPTNNIPPHIFFFFFRFSKPLIVTFLFFINLFSYILYIYTFFFFFSLFPSFYISFKRNYREPFSSQYFYIYINFHSVLLNQFKDLNFLSFNPTFFFFNLIFILPIPTIVFIFLFSHFYNSFGNFLY